MQKTFRIAVAGTGFIGSVHAQAVKKFPNARLVAVADPEVKSRDMIEAEGFDTYQQMIDKVQMDALVIALPNRLHLPAAVYAADKRIPVLMEKPLAVSFQEAKEIENMFPEKRVMVGMSGRYHPEFIEAYRAIKEPFVHTKIGKIIKIDEICKIGSTTFPLSLLQDNLAGLGVALTNGIHAYDRLLHLFGEAKVEFVELNNLNFGLLDDSAKIRLRLANGCIAELEFEWSNQNKVETVFRVTGERGIVEVKHFESAIEVIDGQTRSLFQHNTNLSFQQRHLPAIEAEMGEFLDMVQFDKMPRVQLDEALSAQKLADEVYSKAKK